MHVSEVYQAWITVYYSSTTCTIRPLLKINDGLIEIIIKQMNIRLHYTATEIAWFFDNLRVSRSRPGPLAFRSGPTRGPAFDFRPSLLWSAGGRKQNWATDPRVTKFGTEVHPNALLNFSEHGVSSYFRLPTIRHFVLRALLNGRLGGELLFFL